MTNLKRLANDKGQFVLPAIPTGISPALAQAIVSYRMGFDGPAEAERLWDAAAQAVAAHEPTSMADLVAKLIIAMHYSDPEIADGGLAIEAPPSPADRLATEMQLSCVDWLLKIRETHDPALAVWRRFESAFRAASAACRVGEPYHQQHPHGANCDEADAALPDTPATTLAGVEGKLRNVFLQRNRSDWAEAMVLGDDTPELRRQLDMADLYDRMLWSAIDDLQRLAGEMVR